MTLPPHSIQWVRPPNPLVGMIEVDPKGYEIILRRGYILIDGQRANVGAVALPADDQQYDLVVRFDEPYKPPPRRIIFETVEQADRSIERGIVVLEGKPYMPTRGPEPNIIVLLPFYAKGMAADLAYYMAAVYEATNGHQALASANAP